MASDAPKNDPNEAGGKSADGLLGGANGPGGSAAGGRGENLIDMLTTQVNLLQMQNDALLEVTAAINKNTPEDGLLSIYTFTLFAQLQVKYVALFYKDKDWYLAKKSTGIKPETDVLDVEKVLLPFTEATTFEAKNKPAELEQFDVVIPVYHKSEPLAFALLGYPHKESYESMEDKIKFIQTITNIIVVAIENKRLFKKQLEDEAFKREQQVAGQVQSLLIPDQLPDNDVVQMAAVYLPHQNVGGDYYDYIPLNKSEFVFCIADVSGKGTGAALLMSNFQANVRALIGRASIDMPSFVQELNKRVQAITKGEKFVTMFIGRYNTESRRLDFISAGHNPPVLVRDGERHDLSLGCTILGMFDELPSVETGHIDITPGSVLITYTDGVTDLENAKGLTYSTDHIHHLISRGDGLSMSDIIKKMMNEVHEFKGDMPFVDDISILGMRFK